MEVKRIGITRDKAETLSPAMLFAHCYGASSSVAAGTGSPSDNAVLSALADRIRGESKYVTDYFVAPEYDATSGFSNSDEGNLGICGLIHETLRRRYGRPVLTSELVPFLEQIIEAIGDSFLGSDEAAVVLDAFLYEAAQTALVPIDA